jgi:enoyl-CoA hydratase/carnithine racemase
MIEARDLDGGVRVLTLNRPPANAFTPELLTALRVACGTAENDESVRAVIVTGTGRFFSGGLDLRHVAAGSQQHPFGADFGRNDGIFALWTLSKPTVAMVNGHAIAGGGILCLACDARVVARGDIKLGLNEVAIGLSFPTGAYEIAAHALSRRHLRRVLLDAELFDPEAARRVGIVDEVVAPADLERVCVERARRLGSSPRAAYAHTKRALQHNAVERVVNESPEQRRATLDIWTSPEAIQAVRGQLSRLSSKS